MLASQVCLQAVDLVKRSIWFGIYIYLTFHKELSEYTYKMYSIGIEREITINWEVNAIGFIKLQKQI